MTRAPSVMLSYEELMGFYPRFIPLPFEEDILFFACISQLVRNLWSEHRVSQGTVPPVSEKVEGLGQGPNSGSLEVLGLEPLTF